MSRRNNNNNHRPRGGGRGRGRGRGGSDPGVPATILPAAAAASRPHHLYPHTNAEIDVVIQQWSGPYTAPGTNEAGNLNRGKGPWRSGTPKSRSGAGTPFRGTDSPRRGTSTPRGRGRGRGQGRGWRPDDALDRYSAPRRAHFGVGGKAKTILGKDAPLSGLLYSERPLLRPVKFVRATLTPFLFQHSEDVLKPSVQVSDTTETSHVPTADRVARLFGGSRTETTSDSDSDSMDDAPDDLEEVDFADLAQLRAEVDAIAQGTAMTKMGQGAHEEEHIEEVDFADLAAIRAKVDAAEPQSTPQDAIIEETFTGVYNQTKHTTQVSSTTDVIEDDESRGMQQTTSSSIPAFDDLLHLKLPSDTSNLPKRESSSHDPGTAVVEEELSVSTAPESHPVSITTDDIPFRSDPPRDDPHPLFVVDTTPTRPLAGRSASDVILVDRTGHGDTLGDQDEERIVYVAPHPRFGRAAPSPSPSPPVPRVKLSQTTSMLTGKAPQETEAGGLRSPVRGDEDMLERDGTRAEGGEEHFLSLASLTLTLTPTEPTSAHPTRTGAAALKARKEARGQRERERQHKRGRLGFGAYGAMLSEARLREEDARERRRPRWETRRQGDSDVDFGTEDEEKEEGLGLVERDDEVDALLDGLGGMEIDPDLDMDVDAMQRFVKSMSVQASQCMTMDDIEHEARMRQEEDQGGPDGSSASEHGGEEDEGVDEEEEEVFNLEETMLIAESDGDEELSEDSDDDDDELSPRSSFQARLLKIRERSRGQHPKRFQDESDDEVEIMPWTHSADDEKFTPHINGYVDARDVEVLLDDPEFATPVNKKKKEKKKEKGKQATGYFSPELQAQWAKDRAKKAEYKREREQAKLLAPLDPLSASGHTSRKAMRTAARLDPAVALTLAPRAVVPHDMASLEALMRRFVEDVGGRPSVALPPMDKGMRKCVHEMAEVFRVKSVSKGSGARRYTTLIRTSRTGVGVNEGKVRALMKQYGGKGGEGGGGRGRGRERERGGKGGQMPRHKEGDEVGKEAPKIGESNVGFRMLASMGWSEGDRIGGSTSVGIEAPLTAIMKISKLGLGATR